MRPSALFILSIVLLVVEAGTLLDLKARHRSLNLRAQKRCRSRKPVASPAANISSSPPQATPQSSSGLVQVADNRCGPSGATPQLSALSGPNGHIDWLNCGFETPDGWNPPFVRLENLITVPLGDAVKDPNSPFRQCTEYLQLFEKWGSVHNVPPIIIASFAMLESSCRRDAVGGGGEQGLMQISADKCDGAPNGDCRDPDFNIGRGAKFFADTLISNNGDVLLTFGGYNGWYRHLTKSAAFAAAQSSCCLCQNNADYIMKLVNGFVLNNDATHLGKYFNLEVCR